MVWHINEKGLLGATRWAGRSGFSLVFCWNCPGWERKGDLIIASHHITISTTTVVGWPCCHWMLEKVLPLHYATSDTTPAKMGSSRSPLLPWKPGWGRGNYLFIWSSQTSYWWGMEILSFQTSIFAAFTLLARVDRLQCESFLSC